jgi:hypothetical protein
MWIAETKAGVVFVSATAIVFVLTLVTPSEPVQYADALSVVPAFTVAENVVLAAVGSVAVHPLVVHEYVYVPPPLVNAHVAAPLVTVPDGLPAAAEPETFAGCVNTCTPVEP